MLGLKLRRSLRGTAASQPKCVHRLGRLSPRSSPRPQLPFLLDPTLRDDDIANGAEAVEKVIAAGDVAAPRARPDAYSYGSSASTS